MKIIDYTVAACVAASVFLSCTKANLENTYADQEKKIESFLESKMKDDSTMTVVRNNGSTRLVLTKGSGESLAPDGNVSFYYAAYVFNGQISNANLFDTNQMETAAACKWDTSDSTRFKIRTLNLAEATLVQGLKSGLEGVQGGEVSYIVFSGKYGLGNKLFGMIPANSALLYQVWVESISNE